jgi:16S rRNA (uracil1498-N3)-methyltransferase
MRLWVSPEALAAGRAEITGDDHHYLFRVRRLTVGARVVAFDGEGGEADGEVVEIAAARAVVRLEAVRREPAAALHITVVQALIKGDRMDWCVQKLVEVGVSRIVVVAAERSVVRLDPERAASRQARLTAIAREAAKQSRRAVIPPVELATFDDAVAAPADLRLVCLPAARPLRELWGTAARTASILVGPEGGLSPAEIDRALAAGYEAVSLGPTVLRAETAGLVAVSALRISGETTAKPV